jgi:hypothetical protein
MPEDAIFLDTNVFIHIQHLLSADRAFDVFKESLQRIDPLAYA